MVSKGIFTSFFWLFFLTFAGVKRYCLIGLVLLVALAACHTPTREARRMIALAEQLADTQPDSTVSLIDSVLRMPANLSERQRMDMAFLQAEVLFGCRDGARTVSTISPVMDDDFFDDKPFLSTSPDLERAAAYYARKKQYDKAAQAALYSGFVQQHYNEKEAAMQSFKDAERYGVMVGDSLTVARAQYKMGKMLYEDDRRQEALFLFKTSGNYIGKRYAEQATIENGKAIIYMLLDQNDSSEFCLQRSLDYCQLSGSEKVKHKALNNYSVLYRQQGEYDQAIECLRKTAKDYDFSDTESFVYYLNMGKTFMAAGSMDSATFYYLYLEEILPTANVKNETKLSAYNALSRFAESRGDAPKALIWREKHGKVLFDVMNQLQEQNVYRIQQHYDYESLQNTMNQELARTQRIIAVVIVLLLIVVVLFLYHSSQRNKREAETNANLFHFMQQNSALVESNMAQERKVLDARQQLSDMLHARFKTMQKLSFSIENPKNKIAFKDLEKEVFGDGEHWEAVMEVLNALYPGLWESITLKYPEMNEMEHRVLMLSRFKLSRMEEAALLGISTSVLDKLRTKVRKIVEQDKKL